MNRVILSYNHIQMRTWGIATQLVASALSTCHLSQLILKAEWCVGKMSKNTLRTFQGESSLEKRPASTSQRSSWLGNWDSQIQLAQVGLPGTQQLSWVLSHGFHLSPAAFVGMVTPTVISRWELLQDSLCFLELSIALGPDWQTPSDIFTAGFSLFFYKMSHML